MRRGRPEVDGSIPFSSTILRSRDPRMWQDVWQDREHSHPSRGRHVRSVVDRRMPAGWNTVEWDLQSDRGGAVGLSQEVCKRLQAAAL